MLKLALTFLVICLTAAVLGFSGIAGAAIELAKFLAILFGLLFLGFLLFGITGSKLAT
jgi:uncharacterized membrane protein YtjA (UPF0391 family)